LVLSTPLLLLLGGCSLSSHLAFLDPQGPIAASQRTHLFEAVLLVMIVVLALFAETAREVCPPAAAERFILLSHRLGDSLELGIANSNGVLLNKGQRYFKDSGKSALSHTCDSVDDNQEADAQ
jgi:hypothetical protein